MASMQKLDSMYHQVRSKILSGSMNVNSRYPGQDSPSILQVAVKNKDIELVDYLLHNNVDVNVNVDSCDPALILAVHQSIDLVKKLLNAGADVNIQSRSIDYSRINYTMPLDTAYYIYTPWKAIRPNDRNLTPLHVAANNGNLRAVELLLENNAIVDLETSYRETAFSIAVKNNNPKIIELLLTVGANTIAPALNYSALHWIVDQNNYKLAELLIRNGADVNKQWNSLYPQKYRHRTPLFIAVDNGNKEIVELLINNNADINFRSKSGETALSIAIKNENIELLDVLLTENVIPNRRNISSLLHQAILQNKYKVARFLINIGVDVNFRCNRRLLGIFDRTPLRLAVEIESIEFVKLLVEFKANINESFGQSVLGLAVETNNAEIINILSKAGAKMNPEECTYNFTPLHLAAYTNDYKTAEYLVKDGVNVNTMCSFNLKSNCWAPLHVAVDKGHTKIVELLIKNNADVNLQVETGETALGLAVQNDNFDLTKILLDAGADINKNSCDLTPLGLAIYRKHTDIVEYLINRGADVNCRNGSLFKTALEVAVHQNDFLEVNRLFKAGADINLCTDNDTALHFAIAVNKLEMVEYLISCGADLNAVDKYGRTVMDSLGSDEEMKGLVKRQIVKLKAAGLQVTQENLLALEDEFDDFYIECFDEIDFMKKVYVDKNKFSYYDALHVSQHRLAEGLKYIDNNFVLNYDELSSNFPLYADMIYYCLIKAVLRKKLLIKAHSLILKILENKLPSMFIRDILSYLSIKDLKLLSQ